MTESRGGSSQSSRRRRWDVKTKESFKGSVSATKPIKVHEKEIHKLSHTSDSVGDYINESETDTLSDKLSKLLNEASEKQNDSSDSDKEKRIPSAPPLERSPHHAKKKTKKVSKKSVSPELITSQIAEQLAKMNNDIITENVAKTQSLGHNNLMLKKASSSTFNGNISTIYCEKLNNFIVSTESQFLQPHSEEPLNPANEPNTRASFAVFLQTGFRTFSILCQGLLAGIVLTQCMMLFVMDDDIFIKNSTFSHSIYAIVYFLLSVSLIASFDRSDLSGQDACSANGIKVPWTALFYLTSFVLTAIMTQGDDFIANYEHFSEEIKKQRADSLHWWKVMSIVRSFFIILGWTSIVGDPHTDALRSRIATLI